MTATLSYLELGWFLRGVRMVRPAVDLELAIHGVAKLRLRQHASNRLFDKPYRALFSDLFRPLFAQAALVTAVIAIELLLFLAPGQLHLCGVDHDDMVAGVQERRVDRLVFALEQLRGNRRDPPENLVPGVDHVPLSLNCVRTWRKRTHRTVPCGCSVSYTHL